MTTLKKTGALSLAAIFVVGCADRATPTGPLSSGGPLRTVTMEREFGWPDGLLDGQVRLCKTVRPDDPGGRFYFTVTARSLIPAGEVISSKTEHLVVPPGGTACGIVFTSEKGNVGVDRVVITETTPPAHWRLVDIDTRQILWGEVVYREPRLDDSEDLRNATATVYINNDMTRVVTFTNDYNPPFQGCSPGYWKLDRHSPSWPADYAVGDRFNAVFGIGPRWFSADFTLVQALEANGGGKDALARHAVAALLNAGKGFYPLTTAQVIAMVQAAYRYPILIGYKKHLLAHYNELGCPLD